MIDPGWMRVHHKSRVRRIWDLFTVGCLLYLIIFMPVQLAFDITSPFVKFMENVIDYFFIADLVSNFFTTYEDDDKALPLQLALEKFCLSVLPHVCRYW